MEEEKKRIRKRVIIPATLLVGVGVAMATKEILKGRKSTIEEAPQLEEVALTETQMVLRDRLMYS